MAKLSTPEPEATMVDVELNATSPNELVNRHTVYADYGTFIFIDGKANIDEKYVDKLRKDLVIK